MQGRRRVIVKSVDDMVLYYDVEPDNTVYWIRPRGGKKIQRYRIWDEELANEIRRLMNEHG